MCTIDKIIELLKAQGLTQKNLTDHLGINKNIFSQWKNGTTESYRKYLEQIAEFLGVSVGELIGSENVKSEPIYLDDETRELLDALRLRPEMRTLFKVSKNASKEDVEMAVGIIERFKKGSDPDA